MQSRSFYLLRNCSAFSVLSKLSYICAQIKIWSYTIFSGVARIEPRGGTTRNRGDANLTFSELLQHILFTQHRYRFSCPPPPPVAPPLNSQLEFCSFCTFPSSGEARLSTIKLNATTHLLFYTKTPKTKTLMSGGLSVQTKFF